MAVDGSGTRRVKAVMVFATGFWEGLITLRKRV